MDEKAQEWQKQFERNVGAKEFLRFGAAIIIWNFLGVGVSLLFHTPSYIVVAVFFATIFIFAGVATRWRPAYIVFRWILGNKNLPTEPRPPTSAVLAPRWRVPWYGYVAGFWGWLVFALLLYAVVRYLTK